MTIPTRPLVVNLDPTALTLGELVLFNPGTLNGIEIAIGVRQFLIDHTEWTVAEINAIQIAELEQVALQLTERFKEVAVPKGKKPVSRIGRASRVKRSPSGEK